jgi:diaminohydroxyphosphoribosylaminopyrimidine deaminase/5-amino-6-(5-phosphoribosylamino)uracil reductase
MLKRDFGFGGYIPDILSIPAVSLPLIDDATGMALALRQSMLAVGASAPNPAVGCVVVKNGQILAQGHTQEPGGNHAEVEAFEDLKRKGFEGWPDGATVYVTLEPCSHFGRTPPCAELFLDAKNVRVVIGCKDPNPRVSGAGIAKLRSFGLNVECGVMEAEIAFTLLPFFHAMHALTSTAEQTLARPFIGLKWAQSIDGKRADHHARSQWLTGTQTQYYSHWLRQKYDAIAVGFETLKRDQPSLTVRSLGPKVLPKHPLRICLDPRGHFLKLDNSEQQRILQHSTTGSNKEPWVVFCGSVSGTVELRDEARKGTAAAEPEDTRVECRSIAGAQIFSFRDTLPHPDGLQEFLLRTLNYVSSSQFEKLCGRSIQSLMIEGGPTMHQQFLRSGLFDICHGLIAPLFLGSSAYSMLKSQSVNLEDANRLQLMQSFGSGEDVVCEWFNPASDYGLVTVTK